MVTRDERGFTLVEMMIAAALTMVVVGAAVALATAVQNSYAYEVDDAAVQQEARFALDWISRTNCRRRKQSVRHRRRGSRGRQLHGVGARLRVR
jgi:type II secretory pathway component PulJ